MYEDRDSQSEDVLTALFSEYSPSPIQIPLLIVTITQLSTSSVLGIYGSINAIFVVIWSSSLNIGIYGMKKCPNVCYDQNLFNMQIKCLSLLTISLCSDPPNFCVDAAAYQIFEHLPFTALF